MRAGVVASLAATFGRISLLAVGGANAAAPEVRRQVVDRLHWMSGTEFAHVFAIAQAAPGPNVMLASLIGWRVAGPLGLLAATAAMNLPSCLLAWGAAQAWRRWSTAVWLLRLQAVLAPVAAGLLTAGGLVLARTGDHGWAEVAVSAGVAAFVLVSRRNPLWALGAAACAGVAQRRLGAS